MSESVSKVILAYGGPEDQELGHLLGLMDKFFDATNVRSKGEAGRKRKDFCLPYTSKNDSRFTVS